MYDVFILLVVGDKVYRKAYGARLAAGGLYLLIFVAGTERVYGQEGYLARTVVLEVQNEILRVLARGGDDILHSAAEGRLYCHLVLLLCGDDVGNEPHYLGA